MQPVQRVQCVLVQLHDFMDTDPLVDAMATLLVPVAEIVKNPPMPTLQVEDIICSVCDKHQDKVAKLIAGPTDYICDGCVGDAGALFMRYGWRPGA